MMRTTGARTSLPRLGVIMASGAFGPLSARIGPTYLIIEVGSGHPPADEEVYMVILGIILLILGFLLDISILWTIGVILIVIGVILWILGSMGRAVGGRRYWY
jgi:hypothetical protein